MNELIEFRLQTEIDGRVGELIRIGDKIIADLETKICDIDGSQIKNALAVANSSPHPAVVTNFIRYQIGRSGAPGKAWGDTGLGEKVIKAIEGDVRSFAGEIVDAVSKSAQKIGAAGPQLADVHSRLTRLLLGFLNRTHTYTQKKVCEGKKNGPQPTNQRQERRQ